MCINVEDNFAKKILFNGISLCISQTFPASTSSHKSTNFDSIMINLLNFPFTVFSIKIFNSPRNTSKHIRIPFLY